MARRDWTQDELELVVADYFSMLAKELAGKPYNKAEHNRRLQKEIGRTQASIEFKHQNITAVLWQREEPTIAGYKPMPHFQHRLAEVVLQWIGDYPDFFDQFRSGPVLAPNHLPVIPNHYSVGSLVEAPPASVKRPPVTVSAQVPRKVDYVRRDAENRRLGQLGEQWVLEFERRRLRDDEKRADLADRVEWVADRRGDGLGYDIASFNADSSPRLIEVTTTGLGKYFPFLVTRNEVRTSRQEREAFWLYRVFEFSQRTRLYWLNGSLVSSCQLMPTQYRARAR